MVDVNALIAQAKSSASKLEDQTKVDEGGNFEYEAPAAGKTPARFIGYVELGMRPQRPFQGKDKPDCEEVRLYFELNGTKHRKEIGEGADKRTVTNMISVKVTKKLNDKAGFTKLFKKMVRGRDGITHMAQMLGEGFLIDIVHNVVEKDGKKTTYANMKDADGNWLIGGPRFEDPLSGEVKDVPVPEPTQQIRLLLWEAPTQEQWDSIFVDGTRTVKNERGEEHEVSKNWLQEDIVSNALDFEGSALQALLGGVADLTLEDEVIDDSDMQQGGAAVNPEPAADPNDALASLGL